MEQYNDFEYRGNVDKFLEDLSLLTHKYGISIGGCGCCGSPWIDGIHEIKLEGDEKDYDNLRYVDGKYRAGRYDESE